MRYLIATFFLIFAISAWAADSAEYSIGFSPCWHGRVCATDLVVKAINESKPGERLWMAAYGLTSKPVEIALINAHRRGVDVRVVADDKSNRRGVVAKNLANAGIPLRFSDRYSIMHNKFIVFGMDTVETGSFNFTNAAAMRNAENVIIVRGEPKVARQYADEWQRLWDEAGPVDFMKIR